MMYVSPCKFHHLMNVLGNKRIINKFVHFILDKQIGKAMFLPEEWTKNSLIAFTSC